MIEESKRELTSTRSQCESASGFALAHDKRYVTKSTC